MGRWWLCARQGVFAEQEMVRFNHLLSVMTKSLGQLKKAIKGLVVMSSQLEEMHQCFLFQRVPPAWEAAAYVTALTRLVFLPSPLASGVATPCVATSSVAPRLCCPLTYIRPWTPPGIRP
jgi:hypothetical protein